MKLYEEELRPILDECVSWGYSKKFDSAKEINVSSNGKILKLKSDLTYCSPIQCITDGVGHIDQTTMVHVCKNNKSHLFALYLQDLIIKRNSDTYSTSKGTNYSFVVENVDVNEFARRFDISKRMAYNYICASESIGDTYDEGSSRYSLSFIYNPFIKKDEVIKQNEMYAIRHYKNDLDGMLFIKEKYGSFELSPWSKNVMIGSNAYMISDNNNDLQSFILWWMKSNMEKKNAKYTHINYVEISSMFSRKFQKVSVSKIRRVVKSMECDDVIRISLESFGNRKCYTINYDKIIK